MIVCLVVMSSLKGEMVIFFHVCHHRNHIGRGNMEGEGGVGLSNVIPLTAI